jgi:CRP/FNR family transcriptional regulator, cyclic AMP receptor protein
MMETSQIVEALRDHPFTRGLPAQHVEKLAAFASEVRFDSDQIVFRQGDESSLFFLILSGKIALEVTALGRTLRIQTVSEGEILGWSSVVPSREKQFQARALTACRALAFDGARLREACDQECSLGYFVMRRVLAVVADRLQALRLQVLDIYTPPGAKQS